MQTENQEIVEELMSLEMKYLQLRLTVVENASIAAEMISRRIQNLRHVLQQQEKN